MKRKTGGSRPRPPRPRGKAEALAEIAIVGGAGHVGLPLALSFAEAGKRVLVHDLNARALGEIAAGRMPFTEAGGAALLKKALARRRLSFTGDAADLPPSGAVIVTIGTPVDEFLNPDHKVIRGCVDGLMPHLTDDHLLVLRSTVYPGTTDWLHRYLRAAGKRTLVACCPERVVQGLAVKELAELPQIVSGTTPAAAAAAKALFRPVVPETVELDPLEAEFAKLFDNCYRYIHFAISNELFMIADAAGADYRRIFDAMTYKYPRARGMPRAGLTAGPCLVKDTMQLAAFARNQFNLGQAAMRVNEGLVLFIIDRLRAKFPLEKMTVGLLGMAFKPDSDDTRASLSYKIKNELMVQAKRVLTTDPYVTTDPDLLPLSEVVGISDVLILCVPHRAYRKLALRGKPVVDVWNFLPNVSSAI